MLRKLKAKSATRHVKKLYTRVKNLDREPVGGYMRIRGVLLPIPPNPEMFRPDGDLQCVTCRKFGREMSDNFSPEYFQVT